MQKGKDILKLLRLAIDQVSDLVCITNKQGKILYVNEGFLKITGYQKSEVFLKKPSILKSGVYNPTFYKNLWNTLLSGKTYQEEIINKKKR